MAEQQKSYMEPSLPAVSMAGDPATDTPVTRPVVGSRHWQLPVTLVCAILGALLAAQLHTQEAVRANRDTQRAEVLAPKLDAAEEKITQQNSQIEALRDQVAKYEKAAEQDKNVTAAISNELRAAKVAAGLTPVKGPGILLMLDDAKVTNLPPGADMNPFVVHDSDLLNITNELRAAGAEAISINGQRLVATSEIRCSGPVSRVNGTPIGPPFKICAIGDPDALGSALQLPGGQLVTLEQLGFRVNVTKSKQLLIPAIDVARPFKYAVPTTERPGDNAKG